MEISASELNPLMRVLVIALLFAVPLILVILPRFKDIREILKHPRSEARETRDSLWPFTISGDKDVSICPKCFRQNPPDHKFCGFCGAEIIAPNKEN